jgi:3-isopropylmalate/(R)-2-methylmalate dehydratase small subunit
MDAVTRMWDAIEADHTVEITIDMERLLVEIPSIGFEEGFAMEAQNQYRFLNGLDDVGITLTHTDAIDSYESNRPAWLR